MPFLVNDNVEIAREMDADGVHVGQSDMEAQDVRALLGPDKILGVSAHNPEEARKAQEDGADYLGCGAAFVTGTKLDAKPITAEMMKAVTESVEIPVVAIGGITEDNIPKLTGRGLAGAAVVSAIFAAEDPRKASERLLEKIRQMGVKVGYVTLHVGLGTFRPVKEEEITDHAMHSEYCVIPQETAELINETRKNGGRVICVGTTSCRTLESHAAEDGTMTASAGWTDIFIYPGYRFKAMDALITNFHLPESTLVMLVSAFADREKILNAYKEIGDMAW